MIFWNTQKIRQEVNRMKKTAHQISMICHDPSLGHSHIHRDSVSPAHLGPPGGQHEVCVDVVFSELLGHVESQRAVRVVDVPLGEVGQDGVSAVQLLKLLGRLRVVRVLIGVVPQRQLPGTAHNVQQHQLETVHKLYMKHRTTDWMSAITWCR